MPKSILLTGSTGFVGANLAKILSLKTDFIVKSVVRCAVKKDDELSFEVGDINAFTDYTPALNNTSIVIHCAARAHVMNDSIDNPLSVYREVNTDGTANLARQSAAAGVNRFIFISSIKVNGESTVLGKPFCSNNVAQPEDDYGISKAEAEQALFTIAKETGMEVVIIRPTLVYGAGVKSNFASLMNLVSKGIPLPFGCITKNKRSLVSVDNLVDLIITCIVHPKAANQVFLVSDDHDVSTSEMVSEMAKALVKSTWQLPIPIWCYKLVGKLFNKSDVVDRLTGSLQVDISHTKETLGWKPPQTLQEGFKQTAQAFLQANNK
ncbi:SDR family oxidoreductase [Vibrio cholerae]|nr:SDR family oxidoreductase [Vibrio cholerae]